MDTGEHPPDMLSAKLERFAALTAEDRQRLGSLSHGRLRNLGAREDIIREGQRPVHVPLIVSGWACRYKILPDGRRQILGLLFPGDLCDLRTFVLTRMDHSIGTITPAVIAEVPKETVLELTEGPSRLATVLWRSSLVAEAIGREWIVSLGQRTARERLGHLFCEIFLRLRLVGLTDGTSCELPLTQTEMAESCGLSIVHVNRSLQDLRARSLIELRRRSLVIRDLDRLAEESLFTPAYLHADHDDEPGSAVTPVARSST